MSSVLLDLSNGFADAVEGAGRSVVSVNEGGRAGVSGTVWRDGLIVTAEHTIRDERELTIGLPGGGSSSAAVIGRDPSTDIALLRLSDSPVVTAEFADAGQLRVGQFVMAVGRRPGQLHQALLRHAAVRRQPARPGEAPQGEAGRPRRALPPGRRAPEPTHPGRDAPRPRWRRRAQI